MLKEQADKNLSYIDRWAGCGDAFLKQISEGNWEVDCVGKLGEDDQRCRLSIYDGFCPACRFVRRVSLNDIFLFGKRKDDPGEEIWVFNAKNENGLEYSSWKVVVGCPPNEKRCPWSDWGEICNAYHHTFPLDPLRCGLTPRNKRLIEITRDLITRG